mmetsp:Transcript_112952/g.358781  ORF Transcript_112952/g.358781 Transcript_112952/m.358781 type:complete len:300 (+) Transcript_112952:88-987(+)
MGSAGPQTTRSACCFFVCPYIALAFGCLLVLFGAWPAHLYSRFMPVYMDITCKAEPAKVKSISFRDGLTIVLNSSTSCDNPNPYTVQMMILQGKVYMGKDMTPVTSMTVIPRPTLPASGTGSIHTFVIVKPSGIAIVKPSGDMFGSLPGFIFDGQVPIYMEHKMQLVIDIGFFFGKFSVKKEVHKHCGQNVQMLSHGGPKNGPLVCADSFDQLILPPVGEQQQDGHMHLSVDSVGGKELEEGTRAKNIGLGLAMGIGFGVGSVLLLCSIVTLCCRSSGEDRGQRPGSRGGAEYADYVQA